MDVFISYKSENYAIASGVREYLNRNGITTWMAPESIPGGKIYLTAIPAAISNCKLLVLVLSQECQNSKWILMEIENALKKDKTIIPYVIEQFDHNETFDFVISLPQRINAYENSSDALERLVSCIREEFADSDTQSPTATDKAKVDSKVTRKVIEFENGDTYDGDVLDGEMTGKGRYTYSNGDIYEGDFVSGKRCGKGKYLWFSGSCASYEGDYSDDKRSGKGRLEFANGDSYEGEFCGDEMTGSGTYVWSDGSKYQGSFTDGKITGSGKYTASDGTVYEGEFLEGKIDPFSVR